MSFASRTGRWIAAVTHRGTTHYVGSYGTAEQAAVAHDRGALFFGIEPSLRNFPSRELVAASPETLLAEQRRLRIAAKVGWASSRFVGVVAARSGTGWLAAITIDGKTEHLGTYAEEAAAAVAYDRAARGAGFDTSKLNFPKRRLRPALPSELRADARAIRKKGRTSKYRNVSWVERHRAWVGQIRIDGVTHTLGHYDREVDAARVVDRVVLFFHGPKAQFNLPADVASGRTKAASPDDIERELRHRRKEGAQSRYFGVSRGVNGSFRIEVNDGKRTWVVSGFDDEKEAALTYDRLVLALNGERAERNFPKRRWRENEKLTIADARRELRRRFKGNTTSRFNGVTWNIRSKRWVARINIDSKSVYLGMYADEEEAARAYDRAARREGRLALVNFR